MMSDDGWKRGRVATSIFKYIKRKNERTVSRNTYSFWWVRPMYRRSDGSVHLDEYTVFQNLAIISDFCKTGYTNWHLWEDLGKRQRTKKNLLVTGTSNLKTTESHVFHPEPFLKTSFNNLWYLHIPYCGTEILLVSRKCHSGHTATKLLGEDGEVIGFAGPKSRTPALFSSCLANTEDFTVSNFLALFSHEENEAGKFETVKLGSPVRNFRLQLSFLCVWRTRRTSPSQTSLLRFYTKKTKQGSSRRWSWVCW
jgi:hypothetical protein